MTFATALSKVSMVWTGNFSWGQGSAGYDENFVLRIWALGLVV